MNLSYDERRWPIIFQFWRYSTKLTYLSRTYRAIYPTSSVKMEINFPKLCPPFHPLEPWFTLVEIAAEGPDFEGWFILQLCQMGVTSAVRCDLIAVAFGSSKHLHQGYTWSCGSSIHLVGIQPLNLGHSLDGWAGVFGGRCRAVEGTQASGGFGSYTCSFDDYQSKSTMITYQSTSS
ncbi:unnamed protein product [Nesidiocoris tenuis]|uniref:Uncharacterized protein n=1 Tax=Nesidiocoris tenuis TaxID=355587 RepID=A0A6H5H700_9HEMI|nr:unnamed protein product [Nesidiocoris tenuis]